MAIVTGQCPQTTTFLTTWVLASTVLLVPRPSGGADCVGGQLRGDKDRVSLQCLALCKPVWPSGTALGW